MESCDLVVSRFTEDVSWIANVSPDVRLVLYEKGPLDLPRPIRETLVLESLPNIGREGNTFLYHIVENYDSLADFTVFSQGRNDDHTPHFVDIVNKTRPVWGAVQPLSLYWDKDERPPEGQRSCSRDNWVGDYPVYVEWADAKLIAAYPFYWKNGGSKRLPGRWAKRLGVRGSPCIGKTFEKLKVDWKKPPLLVPFTPGAMFAASRDRIRRRPLCFWEHHLNACTDTVYAQIMEVHWMTLLDWDLDNADQYKTACSFIGKARQCQSI